MFEVSRRRVRIEGVVLSESLEISEALVSRDAASTLRQMPQNMGKCIEWMWKDDGCVVVSRVFSTCEHFLRAHSEEVVREQPAVQVNRHGNWARQRSRTVVAIHPDNPETSPLQAAGGFLVVVFLHQHIQIGDGPRLAAPRGRKDHRALERHDGYRAESSHLRHREVDGTRSQEARIPRQLHGGSMPELSLAQVLVIQAKRPYSEVADLRLSTWISISK